jgi:cellulose biosynthesis protein BcsQ/tetratricopeptide (TPR) repeat protein
MSLTPEVRRVLTFYSFKGGVGRTMLLANIAYRLANKHGLRVIAVDWDLEAPGLHRFFGVSTKVIEKKPGVLDYFIDWRDRVQRGAPDAPDVAPWILPITDKGHAPRFGSLSLLTAGRLDEDYDRRLASFEWQDFYKGSAGASAVETLRAQLVSMADVVLIDSRTGFTDSGGICTIQIPDGVILVTAPNQQSLEGIDRVAHAIAQAPPEARSGRARPRLWFVVSRVPLVEETHLAEQWFAKHEPWFAAGKKAGLWLAEDHPEGIQSHKIPHRGRWGFDETVLNGSVLADPDDLLVVPYDALAETLLRWLRGEPMPRVSLEAHQSVESTPDKANLAAHEAAIVDAERRGDFMGMAASLLNLSIELWMADKQDQAIRRAEQASGIFLSRGAHRQYVDALFVLGSALFDQKRYAEAEDTAKRALQMSQRVEGYPFQLNLFRLAAETFLKQGRHAEAEELVREASKVALQMGDDAPVAVLWLLGDLSNKLGLRGLAIDFFRKCANFAGRRNEPVLEGHALRELLKLSAAERLEDEEALSIRLQTLSSSSGEKASKRGSSKKRSVKRKKK